MFTAEEKRREALREVNMRLQVYPRWVGDGKMSQKEANRRIEIMKAIADDYEKSAERERLL